MHKISTNYLSILYIIYSIIHIRYCVIGDHTSILYLLYPYKILRYCFIPFSFLSPLSPLSFSPPYIYVQYFTQSCVNIQVISHMAYLIYRHYLSIYLVLSISLIYLSYLSPYLISNIYYIYNKYPIYLSLPIYLYTHDPYVLYLL